MMEERERLESSLQSIMTLKTATQKRVWDAEDELRSKVSMLEESERRYASLAEELKLIPKTARNANSKDLSIEIDTR
jgi:kinetochore protein NDC80